MADQPDHMILIVLVNDDRPADEVAATLEAIRNIDHVEAVMTQEWLQRHFVKKGELYVNVNGKETQLHDQDMISYEDVLFMAGMRRTKGLITVTYHNADEAKPDGILAPGGRYIKVKSGTVFNAADTSRA